MLNFAEIIKDPAVWIWIALSVVFFIVEGATNTLVSVWFAVGALFASICAAFGLSVWIQIIIFVLISAVIFFATKPLVKKLRIVKREYTNADRLIGSKAVVTEQIDNIKNKGQVNAGGQIWSARSEDDSIIEDDTVVNVIEIQGVKLIVSCKNED